MDYAKPTLLVISGPNGAGKSTFIQFLLPDDFDGIVSFDRDKIRGTFELSLSNDGALKNEIAGRALRLMEKSLEVEMDNAINESRHFVLETPLSHPDYWKYIDRFERKGYQVQLNYLCLDTIKDCKSRVQHRVMEGGHEVDAQTIKGVYEMNLKYVDDFRQTFKAILLFDGMKRPDLLVSILDDEVVMATPKALKKRWIKAGLPHTALKIMQYFKNQKK